MGFVALLQAAQNTDSVLDSRLFHQYRLEAPFKGGILLDVLAILIKGGCAHHVQLAPRQHRLEHIARVHCAFCRARARHCVQLVNKKNNVFALLNLFEHRLQPFLKLTAILSPGNQGTQIERDDLLFLERFRHIAAHNTLGETLDNRGLADAGFANQHRVVLGTPTEDLDDAADLFVAANHGVELVALGQLSQIAAILLKSGVGAFGIGAGDTLGTAHLTQGRQQRSAGQPRLLQDALSTAAGMVKQSQQQMFGADIGIAEASKLVVGLQNDVA